MSFPDDVADAAALRRYLADTDIFGPNAHEAAGYLNDALERFRMTMALLPPLAPGARVLELGSNPYFLTRLLLARGLDVTCANWFGEKSGFGRRGRQEVTGPTSGERHLFEFDHFNIEAEPFPYPDGTFEAVLFCEILEHLPNDPVHVLAEIHRVLAKPAGVMLLTTPNATRMESLVRMLRGENVYEELSGYGTYGRHNREYTVAELRTLLSESGYQVRELFAHDIHARPPDAVPASAEPADRGDNLFALAAPFGQPRWRYPDWLYSSQHALRRVVRPDLMVGYNDQLQAAGLHPLEDLDGRPGRWTGAAPEVVVLLAPEAGGQGRLCVEGIAPPPGAGPGIELLADVGGEKVSWELACDGRPFAVSAPVEVKRGDQDVRLWTDRTWVPSALGLGGDGRTLGVVLRAVALEVDAPPS